MEDPKSPAPPSEARPPAQKTPPTPRPGTAPAGTKRAADQSSQTDSSHTDSGRRQNRTAPATATRPKTDAKIKSAVPAPDVPKAARKSAPAPAPSPAKPPAKATSTATSKTTAKNEARNGAKAVPAAAPPAAPPAAARKAEPAGELAREAAPAPKRAPRQRPTPPAAPPTPAPPPVGALTAEPEPAPAPAIEPAPEPAPELALEPEPELALEPALEPAPEPAPEPGLEPGAIVPALATRVPVWARVVADPRYAPEQLAREAVLRLGPEAREWVAAMRARYPTATADGLARLAAAEFVRLARRNGAAAGVAGPLGAVGGAGVIAHAQAGVALRIAAAYGFDPTDNGRAGELLELLQVPRLTGKKSAALKDLGRMVAGFGVVRLAARVLPLGAAVAGAVAGGRGTADVAVRAVQRYRPRRA